MKTRNQRTKNYKEGGITLIALVVTVIILLILAGITVSLVVGENGLLQRAQTASNTMANATANELKMMDEYDKKIGALTKKNYAPGLYDETTMEIKKTWDELILDNVIRVANGVVSAGQNSDRINILDGQIIFPSNIIELGKNSFAGCKNLKGELQIPNGVVVINSDAFVACTGLIGNLIIPDSVTTIESYAFAECTGFTGDLIIPNSVTILRSNSLTRMRSN